MRQTTRRLLVGSSLGLAVAAAGLAAARLARLGTMPARVAPYALVFAIAFCLAVLAGALAPGREPGSHESREPDGELARCHRRRWTALAVAIVSLSTTWLLQSQPAPPGFLIVAWLAALLATPFAFPRLVPCRRGPAQHRLSRWIVGLVVVALAVGAWSRLANLGELPPVLGGDEANQILDGRDWISGKWRSDPFGTGWYGTVRLGMLPAGFGSLLSDSPIAGPRIPYAVFGTLALVGAAVAAGQIGGLWAAVGGAVFLAFAPHHVHFSRLASVMVLDSFIAAAAVVLVLATWRRGSPRIAAVAGVVSGLSLYGYTGGRVVPVVLLCALATVLLARRWRARRAWLGLALAAGFAVAAGPNLRFAVRSFDDWNSRFNHVSIFAKGWMEEEAKRLGSRRAIVASQLKAGTVGLLSAPDSTPWFTGHPIVGPPLFVACALSGAGWLLGRRRWVEALLVGLVVAGNLAGVILTTASPTPQRASSLIPALAIFTGVAFAGLLSLIPESGGGGVQWRFAAGTLAAGAILGIGIRDYPLDWQPYARYGGHHAALAQSAARLLNEPRFRDRPVHLHGVPYVHSSFPSFQYFLPGRSILDDDPKESTLTNASFPPGIHLFSPELVAAGAKWRESLGLFHGIRLPHPSYPAQDVGYVFVVPEDADKGAQSKVSATVTPPTAFHSRKPGASRFRSPAT